MTSRESFFECRFVSPRGLRTALVRAWDEREAERAFRETLQDEAPGERGSIEVARTGGGRSRAGLGHAVEAESG
jgi:hypothetical protein